ncbi:uncharacterized protein CANTADRAFT_31082, partial [Suhomyces tanzawaensis NRRL Y-17324]
MADNFGRHLSTRWVKASVPSYGDEWGDEYDYNYNSEETSSVTEAKKEVTPERFELHDNHQTPDHSFSSRSQDEAISGESISMGQDLSHKTGVPSGAQNPSNLVLSIDRFKNRSDSDSDETSDEEPEEQPKAVRKNTIRKPPLELDSSLIESHLADVSKSFDEFVPPTPTYTTKFSNPGTPQSDRSYQSDADSIQNEPANLNVVDSNRFASSDQEHNYEGKTILEDIQPKNLSTIDEFHSGKETDNDNEAIHFSKPEASPPQSPNVASPLVLSIDKKDFNYSSDDDEDEIAFEHNDDIHEEEHDNDNDIPRNHETNTIQSDNESTTRRPIETAALDSLIHDLENASLGPDSSPERPKEQPEGENDYTLQLDSFDVSMPDFEDSELVNTSLAQAYEEEGDPNSPTTPIAPLSLTEEKEGHRNYLRESGHRRSIRKPPPEPRKNLVSVDYSNIADAVSGYMNDNESLGANKNLDIIGEDNQSVSSETKSQSTGENKERISEPQMQEEEFFSTEDFKKPGVNELHPVVSLDSLSTGKFSFETHSTSQRGDNHSLRDGQSLRDNHSIRENYNSNEGVENDKSRRVSTMSMATVNMGGWNPNTNNYRDQFINDNDNESQINFNPHAEEPSNYNKFTKLRGSSGLSEVVSNSSSISVPDTIDAALPQIAEDPDDNEDNQLQPKTSIAADSILQEHSYPLPVFKEERLTPAGSSEMLPKSSNQRYSSLFLSNDLESQETKRIASDSTMGALEKEMNKAANPLRVTGASTAVTESGLTSTKPFSAQSYPVFDWKTIMSASQPIDRIRLLKEALKKESEHDTGLQNWLHETLKSSQNPTNMHIGKIASEAYSNATHNDIRRHASLRSKVSIVKDKVETSGLHATSFGKRFLSRGKKFMK